MSQGCRVCEASAHEIENILAVHVINCVFWKEISYVHKNRKGKNNKQARRKLRIAVFIYQRGSS